MAGEMVFRASEALDSNGLEQVLLENADLIARHDELTAKVEADLAALIVSIDDLAAVNNTIADLKPVISRAIIGAVKNPYPHTATARGDIQRVSKALQSYRRG